MNKAIEFILSTVGNLLMVLGIGVAAFTFVPIIYSEIKYAFSDKQNVAPVKIESNITPDSEGISDFENIKLFEPVDSEFSIIISKIGVNAPVVEDVTTISETEYMEALKRGVAHARGTVLPGQKGNMFLFAHSSLNFWQLGPYATVFNLLNKLERGDLITIFYENRSYTYEVYEMEVVPGWNTQPFYEEHEDSVVTLITCDPPGSTLNRRVIKARLI